MLRDWDSYQFDYGMVLVLLVYLLYSCRHFSWDSLQNVACTWFCPWFLLCIYRGGQLLGYCCLCTNQIGNWDTLRFRFAREGVVYTRRCHASRFGLVLAGPLLSFCTFQHWGFFLPVLRIFNFYAWLTVRFCFYRVCLHSKGGREERCL